MFVPQVVQGRWLSADEVEVIRCLIAEHPHWSRRRLSVAVSEAFNWPTASGQLKDMSARLLLANWPSAASLSCRRANAEADAGSCAHFITPICFGPLAA